MRILIETDDGRTIEARTLEGVQPGADVLIFQMADYLSVPTAHALEAKLEEKTGRTCVVLPARVEKVWGLG